jgi:hypothetical protein
MNLRALAEEDLAFTLEDVDNGGACLFSFVAPTNPATEYEVSGFVGDIGFLLSTEGIPVAGRTVCATWRLSSMKDDNGNIILPKRGWQVLYTDLSGADWALYVTRVEPDRTVGIGRVYLSLNLTGADV